MDVWVVALLAKRTCIHSPHNLHFQKNALTICPLYPFKFIVSKTMRSLNFLAALVSTPYSKFNVT